MQCKKHSRYFAGYLLGRKTTKTYRFKYRYWHTKVIGDDIVNV